MPEAAKALAETEPAALPRRQSARLQGPLRNASREKYDRVLDAAAQLLVDHEFDDISIAQIAQQARVNRTTVYNFFESTSDVFKAVTRRYIETSERDIRATIPRQLPGDLFDQMDCVIESVVRALNADTVAAKCMFSGSKYDAYLVTEDFEQICSAFFHEVIDCRPCDMSSRGYDPFKMLAFLQSSIYSHSIKHHGRITDMAMDQAKMTTRGYLHEFLK